jgi:SagB-type dehydrogenase family enzyme
MPISAHAYHKKTSYQRQDMGGPGLDWAHQPGVFKTYPDLDVLPLPQEGTLPEVSLSSLLQKHPAPDTAGEMTLERLSKILTLTHTITAKARHGGGDFYYRNVASAGALYPFELYMAVHGVSGLDDGLYHHTMDLGGLAALRRGNILAALAEALQDEKAPSISLVFFLTAIFFRSSWKYRERAYRYVLLDTGHLAENLVLALKAQNLACECRYDFDDAGVNRLLAVDTNREGCLAVVCVKGKGQRPSRDSEQPRETASHLSEASRVSAREKDYGLIRQIHGASSTVVKRPSEPLEIEKHLGLILDRPQTIASIGSPHRRPQALSYPEALMRRRSKRNFVPTPFAAGPFGELLTGLCAPCGQGQDGRFPERDVLGVGLLVGNVEGLEGGFYILERRAQSLSFVSEGSTMGEMAHICLDQAWLANSALHVVFLSNLERLDATWGPRGYRYAMLTAGRLGQRIYLGATALGLGCCGIGAFYDEEAAGLLGVNDATRMLYLVAAGPVKR